MTFLPIVLAAGLGWLFFSFVEYGMHRYAFHERPGRNWGSRQHLIHHAQRDLVMSKFWLTWSLTILLSVFVLRPAATALFSPVVGWAFAGGAGGGFFVYEYFHTVTHWRAPRTAYGRFVRRHHLHHHFASPMANHGFTTPLWDVVLGTYEPVDRVVIPRRMAPRWMVDDDGDLLDRWCHTYELRGRKATAQERATTDPGEGDLADAFANLAPS
jgi:sterol desaturase/sphingolipid hydroxylase (fatty acid hydroxylase superfamily)